MALIVDISHDANSCQIYQSPWIFPVEYFQFFPMICTLHIITQPALEILEYIYWVQRLKAGNKTEEHLTAQPLEFCNMICQIRCSKEGYMGNSKKHIWFLDRRQPVSACYMGERMPAVILTSTLMT